ncbi:MAG: hypothetical protein AAGK21_06250 [Bacteroidota bacterium]
MVFFPRSVRNVGMMVALALALGACDSGTSDDGGTSFSFATSAEGWTADIADYDDDMLQEIGFVFEHRPSPDGFQGSDGALYLRGKNVSDDLLMYAKRRVSGLVPGATYVLSGSVVIGTPYGAGCDGPGGPPGEAVVVKLGASSAEPTTVPATRDGTAGNVLSIDIGGQNLQSRGADGISIGDVAADGGTCSGDGPSVPKTLMILDGQLTVDADSDGQVWLLVGTDSGYEDVTSIYIDTIDIVLTQQ